jgi:PAS domain S-box-containing protein
VGVLRGSGWGTLLVLAAVAPARLSAGDAVQIEQSALPQLTSLFWALIVLGVLTAGGIVWMAILRRRIGHESEELRQRDSAVESYYQDLFENAHDIMFTHDLQGNLYSLNKAGVLALGYPQEEAVGLNLVDLLLPEYREAFLRILHNLGSGQLRHHCELEVLAKHHHRVALRLDLRLRTLPGKPAYVQGLAWDVSERKQTEEALRASEVRLRQSLEDRVRLGQDLHDGIIQSIYAIGLNLGECQKLLRENPQEAAQRLGKGILDLNAVIRDVRRFIGGLESGALTAGEFTAVLQSLTAAMTETKGAQFSFDVDPEAADRLSANQATQLLYIAREALSNSLRHGRPRQTTVSLRAVEGSIRLEVRDDGTGFDPSAIDKRGFGLRNIEARARELNAQCRIVSGPGRGTAISVEIARDK